MQHRLSCLALVFAFLVTLRATGGAQSVASLPAGTQLNATLDTALDSASAHVGDAFTAHVQAPYPFDDADLAGAVVTGEVLSVQRAGQGTKPSIGLQFNRLQLADGSAVPIDAFVSQMQTQNQEKSGARVAAYTLGGMLLGNALAKTLFGAAGGGIAGAVGGFLVGNNYKANITVPQGSKLTLQMRRNAVVRQQTRQPQR